MPGLAILSVFGPFFHNGTLVMAPKLYHYAAGTTTQKDVWTDQRQLVTANQPIVGNADGLISAYFSGLYKIEVRTNDDAVILAQWDAVQFLDPSTLDAAGEAFRIGPQGEGRAAEDVDSTPRRMRIVGQWADPTTPGSTSDGERIVIYETDRDKTVIGMHQQNGLWVQSHGADGQPLFALWGAQSYLPPVERWRVTFDGRVKVPNTGRQHIPIVATGNLPAAGAIEDGSILIEDNGAGDRNVIIYAGGQRFRLDGGAAF